jgi:hypothetical protein
MIKGGVVGYIMDNHCSSFDEDEGWMLVWHHRHGMKLNTQRKGIFVGHFYFTGQRLCRDVLDRV